MYPLSVESSVVDEGNVNLFANNDSKLVLNLPSRLCAGDGTEVLLMRKPYISHCLVDLQSP